MDYTGTAVVTGAGSGIGRALSLQLAGRGMDIVAVDRDSARVEAVRAEVEALGVSAYGYVTDVTSFEEVQLLADSVVERVGVPSLLVNNAGIETGGYLWEQDPAAWHKVIDVNVNGVFHCLRAFVPSMLTAVTRSTIVNVASLAAIGTGPARQTSYNASKHAVLSLTEGLQVEFDEVDAPIDLHVVLPGPVSTNIFTDANTTDESGNDSLGFIAGYVTANGLTPDVAAEIILAGLDRGEFWIPTHERIYEAFAAARAELFVGRLRPRAYGVATK